jgi:hypothetical protein
LKFCEQQAPAGVVGAVGAVGVLGVAGVVGAVGVAGAVGAVGAVGDVGTVVGSTTWFVGDNVTGAEVGRGDTVGVGSRMVTAGLR